MKILGTFALIVLFILISVVGVLAEFGTNWTAEFYSTRNFQGTPVTITNINGVNFNWPGPPTVNGQSPLGNQADEFSVRFSSNQSFLQGTYRFDVSFDDALRVRIDGQEVYYDELDPGISPKIGSFDYTFSTGGTHSITLEYGEAFESAVVQFQWTLVGTNITPGPGTVYPTLVPIDTPIPPLTASLVQVRGLAVRTGPYLGATMITTALTGHQFPVFAQNPSEEGVTWYKISVNDKVGWASGRYLQLSVPGGGAPQEGSVFDTLGNAPETGVIAETRAVMNLRARPSTRTAIIGSIPWGVHLPLLGRTVQAGFDQWYLVRYNDQTGWIDSAYITVHGDKREVPIY